MAKERLDVLLVKKGFFDSREKALRAIMLGNVLVNEHVITKAGFKVDENVEIRVKDKFPYVSRGALKLKHGIEYFNLDVKDKVAIDVGASTGGFTEVLLEYGARLIYAIDCGTNQLHWKLRTNPKVISMENTNARFLTKDMFSEKIEVAVIDVSFISLTKILLSVKNVLDDDFFILALIKPQFELEKEKISTGGFVKEEFRKEAIDNVLKYANSIGLNYSEVIESPITGYKSNNVEYLVCFKRKS